MTNKIVQLQDEYGNNIFPIPANDQIRAPRWETVVSTGAKSTGEVFSLVGTSGKSYNFKTVNTGCAMYFYGPNQPSVVEQWSYVRFTETINNTNLAIAPLKPNSRTWSMVSTTIVESNGVGPRSRIEDGGSDAEAYTPIVGIGSSIAAMWIHTTAIKNYTIANSWTIFAEANFAGQVTSYTGAVECTTYNNIAAPTIYVQFTGGKIQDCRHVCKFLIEE